MWKLIKMKKIVGLIQRLITKKKTSAIIIL